MLMEKITGHERGHKIMLGLILLEHKIIFRWIVPFGMTVVMFVQLIMVI